MKLSITSFLFCAGLVLALPQPGSDFNPAVISIDKIEGDFPFPPPPCKGDKCPLPPPPPPCKPTCPPPPPPCKKKPCPPPPPPCRPCPPPPPPPAPKCPCPPPPPCKEKSCPPPPPCKCPPPPPPPPPPCKEVICPPPLPPCKEKVCPPPPPPCKPKTCPRGCVPGTYSCAFNPRTGCQGWQVCDAQGHQVFAGDCPPSTVCRFYEPSKSPYCVPPWFHFPGAW